MAKIIDCMPPLRAGRGAIYPWEEWLNGQVWELTQGVDFGPSTANFVTHALKMIRQGGLSLRVTRRGNKVWIGPVNADTAG